MKTRWGFDGWLIGALLALSAIGSIFIHSATLSKAGTMANLDRQQLIWLGLSVAGFLFFSFVDYRHYKTRSFLLWAALIVALIWLLIFANPIKGARSWIRFVIMGRLFSIEPAEFSKIFTALACADFLSEQRDKILGFNALAVLAFLILLPFALVLDQPALGVAMTFIPLLLVLPVLAPFPRRLLWGLGITSVIFLLGASQFIFYQVLKPHQQDRITTFISPDQDLAGKSYQVNQARIAIGSGGIVGKGLFKGTQNRLKFLPEQHTDFIFSVIGEETGLLGALILFGCYLVLFYRAFQIAMAASDQFGFYIVVGLTAMPLFQALVNIGMVLGLMPATGIPLPLVSYGGTSLLASWISFGIIHSVYRHRFGGRAESR